MLARFRSQLATLALVAVASACGSDSPTAPFQPTATLNELFTRLSVAELEDAVGELAGVPSLAPPSSLSTSCTYTAASQSFVCPTQSVSGLTVKQSYTLLNASGSPQSAFDASTTAALRTNSSVVGKVTEGGTNLDIDATQALTLSGLLTGPHTLNGTSSTHISGTFDDGGAPQAVSVTTTTTIASLVLPPSGAESSWPKSGTFTAVSNATFAGLPPINASVKLTFNGTSKVAVATTVAGVNRSCTLDLATQSSTC